MAASQMVATEDRFLNWSFCWLLESQKINDHVANFMYVKNWWPFFCLWASPKSYGHSVDLGQLKKWFNSAVMLQVKKLTVISLTLGKSKTNLTATLPLEKSDAWATFWASYLCHQHSTLASQTYENLYQVWALLQLHLVA